MQTAANAAGKAQSVIYRLSAQGAVVRRATDRLQDARTALDRMQAQKRFAAERIKRLEELKDRTRNEQTQKHLEDGLLDFRAQRESLRSQEQELQTGWREERTKSRSTVTLGP